MSRVLFLSALVAGGLLAAAPQPQPVHRPLVFEPNRGQAQSQIKWIGQGAGYQIHFTDDAITMVFREKDAPSLRTLKMKLVGSQPWNHFGASMPLAVLVTTSIVLVVLPPSLEFPTTAV